MDEDFSSEPAITVPDEAPRMRWPILTGVMLFVVSAVLLQSIGIFAVAAGIAITPTSHRLLLVAGQILTILLPAILVARTRPGGTVAALRLRPARPGAFVAAIAGSLCVIAICETLLMVQEILIPDRWIDAYVAQRAATTSLYAHLMHTSSAAELISVLALVTVLPGICEETLFRGAIQGGFEQRLRPAPAIILAALLFALMHLQPANFVALAVIGGFLGFIAWRTGSILPSMAAHAIFNLVMLSMTWIVPAVLVERRHTVDEMLATIPIGLIALAILLVIIYRLNRAYGPRPTALLEQ